MNGPNPLLEAPLPPQSTRPTSPPATPGAPPPFFFYKRMSTPQLESPPLEFGEPRDRSIRPLSHVSSRESLHAAHARDDLSVASAGDTGSVSEVLSPSEEVPISPVGNIELDVEEVTEGDAEAHSGLEIVQPDVVEEPSAERDRQRNGDDYGIATRFQDLNCDGDESKTGFGERRRRFLQRKQRRMDRLFKRPFSDVDREASDADPNHVDDDGLIPARRLRRKMNPPGNEDPIDTSDGLSPAHHLRRKMNPTASDADDLDPINTSDGLSPARRLRRMMNDASSISNLPPRENETILPLGAGGSTSCPPCMSDHDDRWTTLPFNASADVMDVDSQAEGVQSAAPAPAPP